ncbi:S1 RNA-binding domain-containing protein [Streptomyces sp. NPDC047315]|uniref:S1 RNA-binding domain-containing protein n=1 Tax=Streptomyces sp. NPDC047315 TaxID=3155142 RepID=UPI0033DB6C9A
MTHEANGSAPRRNSDINELELGQVVRGTVVSVDGIGAFVDLQGVQGFVSVANLAWQHFDHPSDVVHPGQQVTTTVLSVDIDRKQVSLSLKDLQHDPFCDFARTQLGKVLTGITVKLAPIGSFVRLPDGTVGLLPEHQSPVGDSLTVKVEAINFARRQVVLSLPPAGMNESLPRTSMPG